MVLDLLLPVELDPDPTLDEVDPETIPEVLLLDEVDPPIELEALLLDEVDPPIELEALLLDEVDPDTIPEEALPEIVLDLLLVLTELIPELELPPEVELTCVLLVTDPDFDVVELLNTTVLLRDELGWIVLLDTVEELGEIVLLDTVEELTWVMLLLDDTGGLM